MREKGGSYVILEAVMLQVKQGFEEDYEEAFCNASEIISSMKGYISHELQRCKEVKGKYLLLVKWETLEDHTVGFRESIEYQEWKKQLHHFYDPFPTVEHFLLRLKYIEIGHNFFLEAF
jgi:heme-degrading monooxygenase HmoA